jgi:hypothetical protein
LNARRMQSSDGGGFLGLAVGNGRAVAVLDASGVFALALALRGGGRARPVRGRRVGCGVLGRRRRARAGVACGRSVRGAHRCSPAGS